MDGIFISYRREDSAGYAGRLYDRLAAHFGAERVFMDVEGIDPGTDFVDAIERAVTSCEVLIVLIGNEWMDIADGSGRRRLDDPNDFIRVETSTALKRDIRVVPVLLEGTEMPRADELPDELIALSRRQAVEISHKQWEASTGNLIETLDKIFYPATQTATAPTKPTLDGDGPSRSYFTRNGISLVVGLAGVALAGFWLLVRTLPQVTVPPAAPVVPVPAVTESVSPPVTTPTVGRLEAQPPRIDFGTIRVGTSGVARVTLRNTGDADVFAPTPLLEGDKKTAITIENNCPTKLTPAENCTIELSFTPRDAGPLNTRFSIARADGSSIAIALSGTAEDKLPPPPVASAILAAKPASPPTAPIAKPTPALAVPTAPIAELTPAPAVPTPRVVEPAPIPVKPTTRPRPVAKAPAPKILRFTSTVSENTAKLCYNVRDAEQLTITPQPGRVRNLRTDCVSVRLEDRTTFKIVARRKDRSVTDRLVVTPVKSAPAVATDSRLPNARDQWTYSVKGRWPTSPVRTLEVSASSVDPKAVKELLTLIDADSRKRIGQRVVRGPVAYVTKSNHLGTEFSPYLAAFGGLKPESNWRSISTPDTNSFWTGWYSNGSAKGTESVSVPAGTFRAVKVEVKSSRAASGSRTEENQEPVRVNYRIWYAPEVKRYVKMVRTTNAASGQAMEKDTFELVSYQQK